MLLRIGVPAVTAASAIFTASRYYFIKPTTIRNSSSSSSTVMTSYSVRQRKNGFPKEWSYTARDFERMDESEDAAFYNSPRFVTHIDDRCIDALSTYYGSVLPEVGTSVSSDDEKPRILDLASSWISHLPESWSPKNIEVIGVGMNEPELSKNGALSTYHIIDLNKNPEGLSRVFNAAAASTASEKEKFDDAICSVSIDYLVKPREMLADLAKVLKKDAGVHFAFSNRCFPTKVVGRWLNISEDERCDMVADYLHFAGTSSQSTDEAQPGQLYKEVEIVTVLKPSWTGDPLYVVRARKV